MNKVWTIAINTFTELILDRLFFIVLFVAFLLVGLSLLLTTLSFDEGQKIISDFGFLGIQVSGLMVSLFAGGYLVSKEIEKQTCLLMLSRPITRAQFLLGKVLGISLLHTLLVVFLGLFLAGILQLQGFSFQWINFLIVLKSLWMEMAIILAAVVAMSISVRPVLAILMGLSISLLGHWLNDLAFFAEKSKSVAMINLVKIVSWITPQFYKFNWKSFYFLNKGFTLSEVIWMLSHSLGWIGLLLCLATYQFRRKDIV